MADIAYLSDLFDIALTLKKGEVMVAFAIFVDKITKDSVDTSEYALHLHFVKIFV